MALFGICLIEPTIGMIDMAGSTLKVMMKIGLISEEMAAPRALMGPTKILLSIVSVMFSYFFIHIS